MRTWQRRTVAAVHGIAIGAAIAFLIPGTASAQVASSAAASCGYDGYDGSNGNQPLYTHCGRVRVEIKVDHFFWQTTYFCAVPGTQEIPQGTSQWRIIGAEYDGKSC
jgi:hypothetical protein